MSTFAERFPGVVLTLGAAGASFTDAGGTQGEPLTGDVLDTTGAGDAFAAGFLSAVDDRARRFGRPGGRCRRGGPGDQRARRSPGRLSPRAPIPRSVREGCSAAALPQAQREIRTEYLPSEP